MGALNGETLSKPQIQLSGAPSITHTSFIARLSNGAAQAKWHHKALSGPNDLSNHDRK